VLEVRNLSSGYGKSKVLDGVDLSLSSGERVVLMGRNGMGKSTLAKVLIGLLPTWSGSIQLEGESLVSAPPYRRAWAGVGYVPQGRGLFRDLTVEENLRLGLYARKSRRNDLPAQVLDRFPVLKARSKQVSGTLSGGEQQQLSIARALVGEPSVLILDEPSEGIQPNLVDEIVETLAHLAVDSGIAVLLIEQNIDAAIQFGGRCIFLEKGRVVHAGGPEDLEDAGIVNRLLAV
jgi:urea ABC transporter ATP-binding protein UrtE